MVAAAEGYAPVWEGLRDSEQKEFTLSLAKDDFSIEGRVVDLQGRPVVGAAVRVIEFRTLQMIELYQYHWKGLPENVTTDKEGRFRLTGLGRSRMVRLCLTGPTIEQIRKYVPTIPAVYGNDAKNANIEIIAGPTKPINGVVRAKDTGKPLAGVVVRGQNASDDFVMQLNNDVRTVTDDNGRYRLVGLPKTAKYVLMINPIEGYLGKWLELAGTEGLKPIVKNFDLERAVALRLRFIDKETGKPVLGTVHYCPSYDNPRYEEARTSPVRKVDEWYEPDQNGLFSFMARMNGEKLSYMPAKFNPEDLKAHPVLAKRPPFAGGLSNVEDWHAYQLIDAQPADKPLTLDIPVRPKH
jgi:hypothetical protein